MEKYIVEPSWRKELKEIQDLPENNKTKIMLAGIEQILKGFYSAKTPLKFDKYEDYCNYISRLNMAIYRQIRKAGIVFLLLTFSLVASSQKKWFSVNKNDIGMIAGQAISGAADAVNQQIQFGKIGKGNQFWDYTVSWKNKYKDWDAGDTREAFPLSKTAFVFLTDGYHFTRRINRFSNLVSIGFSMTDLIQLKLDKKHYLLHILEDVLIASAANRIVFNIVYQKTN